MKVSETVIDFSEMVKEIETGHILLPDFQRNFCWTTKEQQSKLAASVICKMPIGSILLLDLPAKEYAARRIGSNKSDGSIVIEADEKRQFLLDGQQRTTVMVNLFSNLIHENGGTKIDSLKRRAFLGIPKPVNGEKYEQNFWGLNNLKFPMEEPKKAIPSFYTDEIKDMIFLEDFVKTKATPYNPNFPINPDELLGYCISNEDYYLVPLYLLVQREKDWGINDELLTRILESIAQGQSNYLHIIYSKLERESEQREFLEKLIAQSETLGKIMSREISFSEATKVLQRRWVKSMRVYLDSCIERLSLHIMGVPNSSRAKAIEVFENMNNGGVKLSTFDLIMAKAARVNKDFSYAVQEEVEKGRTYPLDKVGDRIRPNCEAYIVKKESMDGSYNALIDTECINDNGEFGKAFQDAFLNVLALQCNKGKYSIHNYREEMRKDSILRLSADEINDNYKICCEALDRAAFFLKARCGIRRISEVNYQLMYTVLAYLFLDQNVYEDSKVWNLLNAWYWGAIFSGIYDKDQNEQVARDIMSLSQIIEAGYDKQNYINGIYEKVFSIANFSSKEFLLYQGCEKTGIYPKEVLGQYICQFYLSEGYADMFEEKILICTFPTNERAMQLEMHHLLPLKSFQTIYEAEKQAKKGENKKSIVNSPLNMAYISKQSNQRIGSGNYDSYVKYLCKGVAKELGMSCDTEELSSKDIEEILGHRLEDLEAALNSKKRIWMTQWWNTNQ